MAADLLLVRCQSQLHCFTRGQHKCNAAKMNLTTSSFQPFHFRPTIANISAVDCSKQSRLNLPMPLEIEMNLQFYLKELQEIKMVVVCETLLFKIPLVVEARNANFSIAE